jgi:hypothetical protein
VSQRRRQQNQALIIQDESYQDETNNHTPIHNRNSKFIYGAAQASIIETESPYKELKISSGLGKMLSENRKSSF